MNKLLEYLMYRMYFNLTHLMPKRYSDKQLHYKTIGMVMT